MLSRVPSKKENCRALRVQHRFGRMQDESTNGGRIWDAKNFKDRIPQRERDLLVLTGGMWDSFKIDHMSSLAKMSV